MKILGNSMEELLDTISGENLWGTPVKKLNEIQRPDIFKEYLTGYFFE